MLEVSSGRFGHIDRPDPTLGLPAEPPWVASSPTVCAVRSAVSHSLVAKASGGQRVVHAYNRDDRDDRRPPPDMLSRWSVSCRWMTFAQLVKISL